MEEEKLSNIHKAKCHSIFQNLVHCQSAKDIVASAYIREFFETERCDDVVDFSARRNELSMKLNRDDPKRLERVRSFKDTQDDEKVCAQVCIHYHRWHNKQLVAALSWPDWIAYHTVERGERTLATFGIIGAGYGGLKLAAASFRHIKDKLKK
jgi:hypothetical protein